MLDDMKFITKKDFYKKCEFLKKAYDTLSFEDKRIYKYYIYSRPFIKEKYLDLMWEYLNGDVDKFVLKMCLKMEVYNGN
jgi:hypothetical protein